MKLVAFMKVQVESKGFAEPRQCRHPPVTRGCSSNLTAGTKQTAIQKESIPFHRPGKQSVEFESVVDGPGKGTQFLAKSCLLMHGPGVLLQSTLRM